MSSIRLLDCYSTQLAHLVRMASIPGLKQYAWAMAKELDACSSRMFVGIAEDLARQMRGEEEKD